MIEPVHKYLIHFVCQGYDLLESLVLLSEEEIDELATAVNMKPGTYTI